MDCDILLLTEVPEGIELLGMRLHSTSGAMAPRRRWAAVASRRGTQPQEDPHGASAMVDIDGLRVCSSILPWRSCGVRSPWEGATTAEKTEAAVADIEASTPMVWGGDWNHALSGREWSGSVRGRQAIQEAVARLGMQVPTAAAPHRINGLLSIDHIAVPASWSLVSVEHYPASAAGARISDHDAYVVDVNSRPHG